MKWNFFLTFISILLALLLGYWTFSIAEGRDNDTICGVCSAICFIATLVPTFAVGHESGRIAVNLRILAGVCFALFVISHFCFAIFGVKMPYYVIVNGIVLLIFLALYYAIGKTNSFK